MSLQKNETIEITIDNVSSDGNGIGRYEGMVIFVPLSVPGDLLQIRIVKIAKQYAYGKIMTILQASQNRIPQDCPISQQCGGCSFRQMTYEAELEAKRSFVADALTRIGKLDIDVPAVLPSPCVNRYRNKVQYPVEQSDVNLLTYGFYAPRSHRVIPCEDCLLQPAIINQIARRTIELLQQSDIQAYNEASQTGLIRHLYLREGGNSGEIMLCIVTTSADIPNIKLIVNTFTQEFPSIKTILLNINKQNTNVILGKKNILLYGNGHINDALCGVPLQLGPHSFSQVNTKGAEQLFNVVKEYANINSHDILLDLYCGAGIIGLSMAADCKELIGVEIVPQAIESAKKNAAKMNLSNTRFICEDAGTAASTLAKESTRPTIITVDPPRKGCDELTLASIVKMSPQRIVMVSCNPSTMARDLAALVANGYQLQQVQPVDMFPRTKHVECVAYLSKTH